MNAFSASRARAARHAENRRAMVAEVREMAEEEAAGNPVLAVPARVLAALGRVPRHRFVQPEDRDFAYLNRPLPIGFGQTISQPYIVALMSSLLGIRPGDRVLEVGTGCGYQAAVLAELGASVYTLEIVAPLARHAAQTLQALGYAQIEVKAGDGYRGWPEAAPFDAVIVTAGASHVPPALLDQLKPGGRMVIPLGQAYMTQELMLIEKRADGSSCSRNLLPVLFVPLTGGH